VTTAFHARVTVVPGCATSSCEVITSLAVVSVTTVAEVSSLPEVSDIAGLHFPRDISLLPVGCLSAGPIVPKALGKWAHMQVVSITLMN
jgi:hypothetical protein